MKTIIKSIIITVAVLLCVHTSAQVVATKKSMCDEMMKYPYIFEGKVISSKYYTIRTNEKFESYTSYLVEVDKVIKGNISKGTVNVLLNNTILHSDGYTWVPGEALYCCVDAPVKDTNSVNTNSKSLEYVFSDSMSNGELKKDNNDNLIGYFPSIADFYAYIKANYGIDVSTK